MTHSIRVEREAAQRALDSLDTLGSGAEWGMVTEVQARIKNRLEFSNLSAMERDWDIIKRCRALVSIGQEFARCRGTQGPTATSQPPLDSRRLRPKRDTAFVDAAIDGGSQWLRIVNTTDRRLLHEMAESGWDWGDGDGSTDKLSGADGEDDKGCDVSDGEGAISLVRIISGLVEASRAVRYKYRHPRLSVVLTRIDEGANTDVDRLLEKLRNMGGHDVVINIHCANSWFSQSSSPPLETALTNLTQDDLKGLSPTLLIDTSVLIALASDIANSFVQIQPWHRGDIRAQIEEEVSGKSFIGLNVSPVLRSRALVCTWDAAQHFRQIVSLIGSKTEVLRASIILGIEDEEAKASGADLLHRLQRLSIHKLPLDLKLPIRVLDHIKLDVQEAVNNGRLPRAALAIDKDLFSLPANRSTFLYGWLSCSTVVTSNGALTTRLERLMEQKRETDDETGPSVFVFRFNRALTTKGRRSQGIVGADGD